MTILTLKLESQRRTTARVQNTVFKLRKNSTLSGGHRDIHHWETKYPRFQRTREKRIKDSQKRNVLIHCHDYSYDAWHSWSRMRRQRPHRIPIIKVLLNLRVVDNAIKTSVDIRETRYFVVPADDNNVKWIWTDESRPELRELEKLLRAIGILM